MNQETQDMLLDQIREDLIADLDVLFESTKKRFIGAGMESDKAFEATAQIFEEVAETPKQV